MSLDLNSKEKKKKNNELCNAISSDENEIEENNNRKKENKSKDKKDKKNKKEKDYSNYYTNQNKGKEIKHFKMDENTFIQYFLKDFLEVEELKNMRKRELFMYDINEPEITFPPTYKYIKGTNFYNLCKRTGVKLRFHDLRGYYASISVAMGIPDIYLAHMGGWRENSSVLKEHYQKPIASIDEQYADKLNQFFDSITTHALLTENKKPLD